LGITPGDFRWIDWNIDSATKHGCTIEKIESLALNPPLGFPQRGKKGRIWFRVGIRVAG
jgi:hypothetical protein